MTSPQSIRKRHHPDTSNPWNWFHTLSERKASVKSESHGNNRLHRFSNFTPEGGSARLLTDDDALGRFGVLDLLGQREVGDLLIEFSQAPQLQKAALLWKQFQEKPRSGKSLRPLPSA
jgi:hypothetical protein